MSQTQRYIHFLKMSYANGAVLVGGVYIFFLAFGLAQEKIYKVGDADNGDLFRFFFFLVFAMCVSNVLLSFSMLVARRGFSGVRKMLAGLEPAAFREIFLTSLSYVTAMLSTNYALTHVTYPTQVLVKSIKMVPVTVGGFVIFGKRYPWYDYVAVAVVSASLTIFNLAKGSAKSSHQTGLGLFFLFVSLACDALTGPRQDRLLSRFPSIDSVQLMFLTNVFSVITTGFATAFIEGAAPVSFAVRHPEVLKYIFGFCVSAALGQLFIFSCLTEFGSLYLTLITTTRKFFTVLLSVLLFGHRINPTQWACVSSIFASLMFQSYFAKRSKEAKGGSHKKVA